MSVFGGVSKGERNRIKILVRSAMAAQAEIEGRSLGGRPPYGYLLTDALRGIVRCGICGRRMQGSWNNGKPHYRCTFLNQYAAKNKVAAAGRGPPSGDRRLRRQAASAPAPPRSRRRRRRTRKIRRPVRAYVAL